MIFLMSANFALAANLLDSKPVANGANVVLVRIDNDGPIPYYQYSYRTNSGIDWVFYQEPEFIQTKDGLVLYDIRGVTSLPSIQFNESRIAFLLTRYNDGILVTLDVDTSSPLMHEDRFVNAFGMTFHGVDLESLNKMAIIAPKQPGDKPQTITRGNDGMWLYEGKPFTKGLRTKVLKVPLPKMSVQLARAENSAIKNENAVQLNHNQVLLADEKRLVHSSDLAPPKQQVKTSPAGLADESGWFSQHWTWVLGGVLVLALLGWRKMNPWAPK